MTSQLRRFRCLSQLPAAKKHWKRGSCDFIKVLLISWWLWYTMLPLNLSFTQLLSINCQFFQTILIVNNIRLKYDNLFSLMVNSVLVLPRHLPLPWLLLYSEQVINQSKTCQSSVRGGKWVELISEVFLTSKAFSKKNAQI